jgi:hypothetical protein
MRDPDTPPTPYAELFPALSGIVVFGVGTWVWVNYAVLFHNVPSFLWAFTIAFAGTTSMRQLASKRTDYLVLLNPVLAGLSTLSALYLIRMDLIRQSYAASGRIVPDWWTSTAVFRDIISSGGTRQGQLELAVLLIASLAGLTCAYALIPRGRD